MGHGIVIKLSQLALALLALPSFSFAAPALAARDETNMTSYADPEYLAATVTLDNGVTVYTQFLTDEARETVKLAAKVGLTEALRLRGLPSTTPEDPAINSPPVEQVDGGTSDLDGRDLLTGRSTGLTKRRDSCGTSSFENQSSGGSPTVNDCQIVANTAYAINAGWYIYTACGGTLSNNYHYTCYYPLVIKDTCQFGATQARTNNIPYDVGSGDIGNLVQDSIARFQWNGLVGAKGEMTCQHPVYADTTALMGWAVYHT